MRTVNIDLGSANGWQTICIGRRGENEAEQVVFDISSLIATYGTGTAVLFNKRNGDSEAYPVFVEQRGNSVIWTASETDTAVIGSGSCELWYYVNNSLAKTLVFQTYVAEDIGVPGDPPPEPFENWVEQLADLGEETLANAQLAEYYADLAQQGASEQGWVHFYIDENGHLHYVRTENAELRFYIEDGRLHVTNTL